MKNRQQYNRYRPYTTIASILMVLTAILIAGLLKNSLTLLWYWIIIIVYFIVVSFFVRYQLPKNYLSNDFRKEIIDLTTVSFIALAFFGFAESAGDRSDQLNVNLPFDNYEFTIQFKPYTNIVLNNFETYYDFDEHKGNISFIIREVNTTVGTRGFFIHLPKGIQISDHTFKKDKKELTKNKDYNMFNAANDGGGTTIAFEDFKKSLESVEFVLQLNGNLVPNGLYRFYVHSKYVRNQHSTIAFNLGDYDCKSSCFENLFNSERETNGNILRISYGKDYYGKNQDEPKILQQFFILTPISCLPIITKTILRIFKLVYSYPDLF